MNKTDLSSMKTLMSIRELPKNNLRILFALLPVLCVVITGA